MSGLTRDNSPAGRVLQEVREGRLVPVATDSLAAELTNVLLRPKVRAHFGITDADVDDAADLIVRPLLRDIETGCPIKDPKDERVVASAIAGGAEVIVSGDAHLHDPEVVRWLEQRNVKVQTPARFMAELDAEHEREPEPEVDRQREQVQRLVRQSNLREYGVEDPMEVIATELRGLEGVARMERTALALQRLKAEHQARPGAALPDRRSLTHERDHDLDDRGL